MASFEEYREQRLAAFQQYSEQALRNLRGQLREDLQTFCEEKIAEIQTVIKENNENAARRFEKAMADVEEMKQQGEQPIFIETLEHLAEREFEGIIAINKRLLDGFIANVRRISERR